MEEIARPLDHLAGIALKPPHLRPAHFIDGGLRCRTRK